MGRPRELLPLLGRTLYLHPEWGTQTGLARRLNTTPSGVEPWIHWLSYHRAIRFESGRVHVDRPRLLTVLAAARMTNLRPVPPFTTTLSPTDIHDRLETERIPHVFGFFTAANQWSFFEPRSDCHLYVDRGRLRPVQRLLRQPAPTEQRPTTVQAYLEPLSAMTAISRGGLPITGLFETILDLRAHPEGGAHADFLEKNVLPRLRDKDAALGPSLDPHQ